MCKSPACHTLGLGVLPPTGATTNILVRGAHRLRLHLKRSGTRRSAAFHVGRTPDCRALGRGVREISVAAGKGADVMAGSAGAAGPALDVRHQPLGRPELCP